MHHPAVSFTIAERNRDRYVSTSIVFNRFKIVTESDYYIDVLIDGKNFLSILDLDAAGVITPYFDGQKSFLKEMLSGHSVTGDLPSGIAPVYVCSECGDYGCGAFGWKIMVNDHTVTWSDFQWDDNLGGSSDEDEDGELYDDLVIKFDRQPYFDALQQIDMIENDIDNRLAVRQPIQP